MSDYNICCSSASLFSSLIYKVGIKEKESEAEMWQSMSLYRMIDLPFVEKHPPDLESFGTLAYRISHCQDTVLDEVFLSQSVPSFQAILRNT